MRMLMTVKIPNEPFNTLVRTGTAGTTIGRVLDEVRPEAIYFTTVDGQRGAVAVVEVADASQIPRLAEPFFLSFNADCTFAIAMTPDDLGKAGLDKLGKQWG